MRRARVLPFALTLLTVVVAQASEDSLRDNSHWDGSRTTPVHNFAMYDETGQQIVPDYALAMPMSSRNTCGTCHTYGIVSQGWHFNSSKRIAPAGRPGEPWVLVDPASGTQLPLSYRDWPGMWNPDELGVSPWEFTKRFARHMPGGDFGEPSDSSLTDENARWDVSGKLEVNCLACHNGSPTQDHSEYALQNSRENFRWSATAASGLGSVKGMASRIRSSWIIGDGPSLDDKEFAVAPQVDYHEHKFDSKNRTVFDVRHKPPDQNCLQCHSASPVHEPRWTVEQDVHSAVGIKCADCHRNGLDHNIIRGYSDESKERKDPHVGEFSCAGCHVGTDKKLASGRMGAPVPAHAGIPPIHFEKMECTVCHSGPLPDAHAARVRTSRANRLGIHGRAQWFTEAPYLVEPVFVRGKSGKVEPHRMMWPAFWAKMENDKLTPLLPQDITKAGAGILDTDQRISTVLQALGQDPDAEGTAVLAMKGKLYSLDKDGFLKITKDNGPATETGTWGRETTGTYVGLLPDFDTSADLESNISDKIQRILDLLERMPGDIRPAVLVADKRYMLTLDGSMETTVTATRAKGVELAKLVNDQLEPLVPQDELSAFGETAGSEHTLNETKVARVLERLDSASTEPSVRHAYVGNGRAFKLDGSTLAAFDHESAKPVSWAIGHDVRPAAQSLGVKSCAECHSEEAAYLFADVMPTGPLMTAAAKARPMHEFQKLDGDYQKLFGMSFKVRSAFKTAMFVIAGVLALLLLAFTTVGLRRLSQYVSARS